MSEIPAPQPGLPGLPGAADAKGVKGMFQDASTLASTGLIFAVFLAIGAGLINFAGDHGDIDMKARLLFLTDTVDVGDVALLGIAVALLLLTPDPPGGVPRSFLMRTAAIMSGVTMLYMLIRSAVLLTGTGDFVVALANSVTTLGVAVAAFTVTYYAWKEASIMEKGDAIIKP